MDGKLTTLPAWYVLDYEGGMPVKRTDTTDLAWSNRAPPPAIGARVRIKINAIGEAIVTGYWAEGGYLGLLTRPVNPPDWYVRQNGGNVEGACFGSEIEVLEEAQ